MTDADQIQAPLGLLGSGRLRYGAAMRLWEQGQLSTDALEVYRICAARDGEDPAVLMAQRGAVGPMAVPAPTPEEAIRTLLAESDRYLATMPGPGVADVRAGIARGRNRAVTVSKTENTVVAAHLPTALAALLPDHPTLALAIRQASPHLRWQSYDGYDPTLIGDAFLTGHAFCSLMGQDGAIPAQGFALGLFLIAPHILYRDHHHAAPELYAPLTGPHGWRFQPGAALTIKLAHVPVWNDPFQRHLTKVGPLPFLALFGWTADVNDPAKVLYAKDWAALEALRIGEVS